MKIIVSVVTLGIGIFLSAPGFGSARDSSSVQKIDRGVYGTILEDPTAWVARQKQAAISRIQANISRSDTAPGSVVASPQHANPDYYFHWIRDSALTMDVLASLYQASSGQQKAFFAQELRQYVQFSLQNQAAQTKTGLGEPKFFADGRAYDLPWGRPQNDGPALRAVALIHLGYQLLKEGQVDYVRHVLYDGTLPSKSAIKADLEFVSHHWRDPSFDLWEEVKGDHFYTRMVQRRAMVQGAQFARIMGDLGAADFYQSQAVELSRDMARFWRSDKQVIVPTLNRIEGLDYKRSDLDIAVLLGVLHGDAGDGFLPASHPSVMGVVQRLTSAFQGLYAINQRTGVPGVAIGRYPEDRYNGTDTSGGNAWVLSTAALAEIYYKAAREMITRNPSLAKQYLTTGDQFLLRLQYHSSPDGMMAEQMDRSSGFMISARDLTWSYASFLTALAARQGWSITN